MTNQNRGNHLILKKVSEQKCYLKKAEYKLKTKIDLKFSLFFLFL
jgi:hypothetical protein